MIVIDLGNTTTVIGIYFKKQLKKIFKVNTDKILTKKQLSIYLQKNKILKFPRDYKICIISSVVKSKDKIFVSYFKNQAFIVKSIKIKNVINDIKFNYQPNQLGADRIANSYSAINKYGKNSLVIDFGTATTFDIIKNNVYEGGVIAPGINVSHEALVKNASKLERIQIKKINKVVGKDTKSSMQSGFYWGYVGLINGIIKKIIIENNFKPKIILTGGLSNIFKKEIKFQTHYEPDLTLDGLYLIGIKKYGE